MSDEARIKIGSGFQGGSTVMLNADSVEEMQALVASIFEDEADDFLKRAYSSLHQKIGSGSVAAATAQVQSTLGAQAVDAGGSQQSAPRQWAHAGGGGGGDRVWLNLPFDKKDYGKSIGARWDAPSKKWYAAPGSQAAAEFGA